MRSVRPRPVDSSALILSSETQADRPSVVHPFQRLDAGADAYISDLFETARQGVGEGRETALETPDAGLDDFFRQSSGQSVDLRIRRLLPQRTEDDATGSPLGLPERGKEGAQAEMVRIAGVDAVDHGADEVVGDALSEPSGEERVDALVALVPFRRGASGTGRQEVAEEGGWDRAEGREVERRQEPDERRWELVEPAAIVDESVPSRLPSSVRARTEREEEGPTGCDLGTAMTWSSNPRSLTCASSAR